MKYFKKENLKNIFSVRCISCLLLLITGLSCSKTNITPDITPKATISFTAGGTSYNWIQNDDPYSPAYFSIALWRSSYNGVDGYELSADDHSSVYTLNGFGLYLKMLTSSLSPTTYTLSNPADLSPFDIGPHSCSLRNIFYYANTAGDFATITISKIHDGYADGTFTAKMTLSGTTTKLNISNGIFKNVKIMN